MKPFEMIIPESLDQVSTFLQDANANVVVNLSTTGANSSVIIGFTKGTGYNEPDLQNLQYFQR